MNLMMWIFRDLTPEGTATFPRVREYAKMAADSALQILRFGVESRIWLPHSMVGQYLLCVPDLASSCLRLLTTLACY